jgi:hypothetical protein
MFATGLLTEHVGEGYGGEQRAGEGEEEGEQRQKNGQRKPQPNRSGIAEGEGKSPTENRSG